MDAGNAFWPDWFAGLGYALQNAKETPQQPAGPLESIQLHDAFTEGPIVRWEDGP